MVSKKMYLTGGIGAKRDGEAFGENYELPNLTAYNETCAAIGDVYWNHRLFLLTGDSKYYDIIERSLYNGLISGISADGKKFFYPNPLESDGKHLFNMGACTRQSWFDCSCCPTNLIRFIPSIPGLIYASSEEGLYVNLFASNRAALPVNGTRVELTQQTDYPWEGNINLTVKPEKKSRFTLRMRIPGWARNQVLPGDLYRYTGEPSGDIRLKINGKSENPVVRKGYVEITREWSGESKIELNLPMQVRRVITDDKVPSNANLVAFECGPVVYCAEDADNQNQVSAISIPGKSRLMLDSKAILSEKVNVIRGSGIIKGNEFNMTLIPYYLWSNRGIGKMKVWFPQL